MAAPTFCNPYEPRVGLFWFLAKDRNASRFVTLSRPASETSEQAGVRRLFKTHREVWPDIQRLDQRLEEYDFDFFPRGHVEFSRVQERWFLFLDQKLLRGAFVAHVVIEWNIPRDRLAARWRGDYRSVACVGPPM
jgi:hypothetical protein